MKNKMAITAAIAGLLVAVACTATAEAKHHSHSNVRVSVGHNEPASRRYVVERRQPAVVYREPAVVYREVVRAPVPVVQERVYIEPAYQEEEVVIYRERPRSFWSFSWLFNL